MLRASYFYRTPAVAASGKFLKSEDFNQVCLKRNCRPFDTLPAFKNQSYFGVKHAENIILHKQKSLREAYKELNKKL